MRFGTRLPLSPSPFPQEDTLRCPDAGKGAIQCCFSECNTPAQAPLSPCFGGREVGREGGHPASRVIIRQVVLEKHGVACLHVIAEVGLRGGEVGTRDNAFLGQPRGFCAFAHVPAGYGTDDQ